jgi:hypothetical protein
MPRILHLMGVSLAAAATSTVSCSAATLLSTTTECQSCTVIGSTSTCTNFTAAVRPNCSAQMCSATPCPTTYSGTTDACGVCVNALLGLLPVCLTTTANIGYALTSSLDFSLGASVDLEAFTNPEFVEINATATNAVTAANSVVQVTGSNVATIAVGASTSTSVALFDIKSAASANVAVTTWTNNANAAKVDSSARLTIDTLLTGGSYFSVWQSSSAAVVTFNNIDFSSRAQFTKPSVVHVAGGSASVNASGVKFSSGTSGTLKLTGGASIATTQGSLPQALTIDITAHGQSAPVAVVEATGTLRTYGEISGSASSVLVVNGQVELGATTTKVQPQVVVKGGASSKVTVNSSAATFVANDVQVGAAATLELGVNTYNLAKSGALMFNKLWVDAQGHVKIHQSAAARTASKAGAVVAFNYSSNVNVAALAQATVSVVTSTGATVKLSSTTTAAAGRRLLAGTNTATWGPNGMSYTYDGSANGAAQVLALPVVLIGLFGLFL